MADLASERAKAATLALVTDLDEMISDDPVRAVFFGTVALAASEIVFSKYNIPKDAYTMLYENSFEKAVEEAIQS